MKTRLQVSGFPVPPAFLQALGWLAIVTEETQTPLNFIQSQGLRIISNIVAISPADAVMNPIAI